VQQIEIPLDLLNKQNVIAVSGFNGGEIPNPAGLLFALRLAYTDGSTQVINSDESWKTTADTLVEDWIEPSYDDEGWKTAWRSGSLERSYWGAPMDFRFEPDSAALPFARASLVRLDDFMKTLGRPVRENVSTRRSVESTLLKSLMLTNSNFFHDYISRGASSWMEKMGNESEQMVEQLYLNALGRAPNPHEKQLMLERLDGDFKQETLEDIIWAIVLLPEFQLI